jgi:hypothetical protein
MKKRTFFIALVAAPGMARAAENIKPNRTKQ